MSDKSLLPQIAVNSTRVLTQLSSGQLLTIDSSRRGGLIVCKRHHAEFAGPGSAVGGVCDIDCNKVIPVGDVSVIHPQSYQERQKAYAMRQKWFRFGQKAMSSPVPLKRAYAILFMLEKNFGWENVSPLPDEIIAQLVGVLPKTAKLARQYRTQQLQNKQQESKIVKEVLL